MRLDSLLLEPYGALSDAQLELGKGLNVVYGLNEAGKSTLLSAYVDLLCGIPRKTPMDFLVQRSKLRICARITLDDGTTVQVIRTSKNAPNDLLDAETSEPVANQVRRALTEALDDNSLLTRFGLDHNRLVAGGRKLMEGQGDLADIVFEARSGTDMRVLVDQLDDRAAKLYTPRMNSTSDLMQANKSRDELDRELMDTMATAEAVEAAANRQTKALADLDRARLDAERRRNACDGLTLLVESWPYWEQYRARQHELDQIEASGPCLASEQLRTVTEAFKRLGEIDMDIRQESTNAEEARQELSQLVVENKLLEAQSAVDTLSNDKHRADEARTRIAELGRDAAGTRAELSKLLGRLGLHDDANPIAALAAIAVPDDRVADLDSLATEGERLCEDMQKAQQSVREAAEAVEAAERAADTVGQAGERPDSVDPAHVSSARERRNALWDHVRRNWLAGVAVPIDVGSGPDDLANRYEDSVAVADGAADELVSEAGRLSQELRKEIRAAATAQATISERRRALSKAEQALDEIKQLQDDLQSRWQAVAEEAGLPDGLGVPGWRERAELLLGAQVAAERLSDLEREKASKAQTVTHWDAAAAALATDLGQSIQSRQLVAWFDEITVAYELSKSNKKAAEVHAKNESKAIQRAAQLNEEKSALEESLDTAAAERGVERAGLEVLVQRTESHGTAVIAIEGPAGQLRARHPESTLDELTQVFVSRDREQLDVDLSAAKDALSDADDVVAAAQEHAIEAKNALNDLTGRTGAEALQQELSQATAQLLEIVEEWATTRLMHHLLTQELRAYLESHQNPVLERAGSYLSRLTQGRYTGLRADGEGTDRSLIVIGADDADYEMTALSEGTASQLYLALSLAGVLEVEQERRKAGQETVPIMLDDVLMAFDDERAASALNLLAEIGEGQQIVLFTHHTAVREQAGAIAGAAKEISLAAPAFPE